MPKRFIEAVQANLPRLLLSVQVDGGSEFMRHVWRPQFENACEQLRIPLRVLPPRRPQWRRQPAQGRGVERANRSARIEFWNLYDGPLTIKQVAQHLASYEFFYNYQRPHASLAYQTPNEYIVALELSQRIRCAGAQGTREYVARFRYPV